MTTTPPTATTAPVDAVIDRLNDPAVAASVVTLLDNAELLSTLVLGLSGMLERGDTIIESISTGIDDVIAAGRADRPDLTLPTPAELTALVSALSRATPVITNLLDSEMVSDETVAVLSRLSGAVKEGAAAARTNRTSVRGVWAALKALKEPEVARGLGFLVEIARALGRRLDHRTT